MCTAATYQTKDFYMGRTLDYEFSYGEEVTITPRNYEFDFRYAGKSDISEYLNEIIRFIMMRLMKRDWVWQDLTLWGMRHMQMK